MASTGRGSDGFLVNAPPGSNGVIPFESDRAASVATGSVRTVDSTLSFRPCQRGRVVRRFTPVAADDLDAGSARGDGPCMGARTASLGPERRDPRCILDEEAKAKAKAMIREDLPCH